MTEAQVELAKRAVICKGWRWMPGMRTQSGLRLVVVWGTYNTASVLSDGIDDAHSETVSLVEELPDITDPATLGCLLSLVREARGEPTYLPTCLDSIEEAWVIEAPSRDRQTRYGNYASVLLSALRKAGEFRPEEEY